MAENKKDVRTKERGPGNKEKEINAAIEERKDIGCPATFVSAKNTAIAGLESNVNTTKNVTNNIQLKEPIIDQPVISIWIKLMKKYVMLI